MIAEAGSQDGGRESWWGIIDESLIIGLYVRGLYSPPLCYVDGYWLSPITPVYPTQRKIADNMMNRLNLVLQKFEQAIQTIFGHGFPPGSLCVVDYNSFLNKPKSPSLGARSLKEILENSILWAVPKHRRTLEVRLKRRFGVPKYVWKPPVAKTNILTCANCGYHYEAGRLCGHCYEKVKLETKEMQDAIQKELGLNPVEENVIVLYDGEKESKPDDFWKNQRVVELPKKRPSWFHQNLLEPTTQEPSDKKDIKPTNLA